MISNSSLIVLFSCWSYLHLRHRIVTYIIDCLSTCWPASTLVWLSWCSYYDNSKLWLTLSLSHAYLIICINVLFMLLCFAAEIEKCEGNELRKDGDMKKYLDIISNKNIKLSERVLIPVQQYPKVRCKPSRAHTAPPPLCTKAFRNPAVADRRHQAVSICSLSALKESSEMFLLPWKHSGVQRREQWP